MSSDVVCKYIPILLFAQVFVINNQILTFTTFYKQLLST